MTHDLKNLLTHLSKSELTTADVLKIFHVLTEVKRGRERFHKATTPETEALARWNLDDARKDWERISKLYNLPKFYESSLSD